MIRKYAKNKKNKILLITVAVAFAAYLASYRLLDTGTLATAVWLLSGAYLAGFAYSNRLGGRV